LGADKKIDMSTCLFPLEKCSVMPSTHHILNNKQRITQLRVRQHRFREGWL